MRPVHHLGGIIQKSRVRGCQPLILLQLGKAKLLPAREETKGSSKYEEGSFLLLLDRGTHYNLPWLSSLQTCPALVASCHHRAHCPYLGALLLQGLSERSTATTQLSFPSPG